MTNRLPANRSVVFLFVLLASGCAQSSASLTTRVAAHSEWRNREAGLTATERALVERHCPDGQPAADPAYPFGLTRLLIREGYVLEHSSNDKIALWVCEEITRAQVTGPLPRPKPEPFKPDPMLSSGQRSELSDYRKSGFDRGHQAPSGNQTVDQTLQNETFFLSNMAPQRGPFNQQIWRELEELVRKWAEVRGTVKVINGPLFWEEEEDVAATADGFVDYQTIGANKVAVPTHFFKIVVATEPPGPSQAIAFVIENRGFARPFDFSQFIRSIDWIEERAAFNFLPELSLSEEARLERAPGAMWPPP